MAKKDVPTFLGRIVKPPFDAQAAASNVKDPREIWFPISTEDVATAVALTQNERVFVRSGTQAAAAADVVDAAGGIVINLAELKKIDVTDGVLNAEVAVTTGAMAKALTKHELALPLSDNPEQVVASNVLHDGPSCLMRTLGPLSRYVSSLSVVSPAGQTMIDTDISTLAEARAGNAVITKVAFKPISATNLWMFRKSFPYPGKDLFAALAKALLLNEKLPKQSDLVLDAYTARYDIPVVRITAAGLSKDDEKTVREFVDEVLADSTINFAKKIVTEHYLGASVIQAIVDVGFSIPDDSQVDAHRVHQVSEESADGNQFLELVTEDVNRGLAYRDDQTGMLDENIRLFVRVQPNREDRLELSGLLYTTRPATSSFPSGLATLAPVHRAEAPISRVPAAPPVSGREALESSEPGIPDFNGDVYTPSDWGFSWHASQYATSSYPRADMTPFMLAYPRDEADIKAAIIFAKTHNKHIVARSGGHQYSGLSSGGDATIVLSMDAFNHFRQISDHIIEVGPAVRLTQLASELRELGITIPHGECPLVCIGGHAQTGGFGHLRRGFGLELDYVIAFTIVLADGAVRTIQRPAGAPTTEDEELFWGVLGGNAGSFGIIINYQIECIKDTDYPNSYSYTAARWYDKARYTALMKEVQTCTEKVEAGTLRPDINFSMSVESNSGLIPHPILIVELLHMNLGGPEEVVNGDEVFHSIIQAVDVGPPSLMDFVTIKGPQLLSVHSDAVVRRYPLTTIDGREFRYPYKKRTNCTSHALTDVFIERFVDLVDKIVTSPDSVYLVFQMMIGGGNFQKTKRRASTSIPRRDFVFGFSFYIFYAEGFEAVAEQLQQELQVIVETDFSPDQEQRLFWASFGDTDITKPKVRDFYYDDIEVYKRLQTLKQRVDPDDVFHTSLTVKLP